MLLTSFSIRNMHIMLLTKKLVMFSQPYQLLLLLLLLLLLKLLLLFSLLKVLKVLIVK